MGESLCWRPEGAGDLSLVRGVGDQAWWQGHRSYRAGFTREPGEIRRRRRRRSPRLWPEAAHCLTVLILSRLPSEPLW